MTTVDLRSGDCLDVLKELPDCSVDAIVTDPPYGLSNTKPAQVADVLKAWVTGDTEAVPTTKGGFMGKDWDSFVPPPAVWKECMRVLKPGGHMAVFAGARTQDLMGLSIRLAGFRIKDTLGWIFGSGFPKSMDISKAIDKAAGVEREVVGRRVRLGDSTDYPTRGDSMFAGSETGNITAPATDAAKQWEGWGTQIKPAIEPIILAQKPLDGTVANNVLAHGVGGLNIDVCRVGMSDADREVVNSRSGAAADYDGEGWGKRGNYPEGRKFKSAPAGRFPANVLLDEHAAQEMDKQSGWSQSPTSTGRGGGGQHGTYSPIPGQGRVPAPGDSGGASRFFPVFKSEEEAPVAKGRFPANVLLDEHAAAEMDKQSGFLVKRGNTKPVSRKTQESTATTFGTGEDQNFAYDNGGGASRFFPVFKYQAKAPKRERPVVEREDGTKIQHPTVKPVALMEWLVELITPPGGVVLDPFAGSGTTLEAARNKGFSAIGIEREADYIRLIETRLAG